MQQFLTDSQDKRGGSSKTEPSTETRAVEVYSPPMGGRPNKGGASPKGARRKCCVIVQPAAACTSALPASTLCVDLKGWPAGLMTWGDWLDAGGPLDATERLPIGGAWCWHGAGTVVLGGSVQRPGALA